MVEVRADGGRVVLSGALDASSAPILANAAAALWGRDAVVFDCEGISAINSKGAAVWSRFLDELPADLAIEFEQCSVDFIDFANLVVTLLGRGLVTSFHVPFTCTACGVSTTRLVESKAAHPDAPPKAERCACGSDQVRLDVMWSEYLTFMGT